MTQQTFPVRLRTMRRSAGLSQVDLAARAGLARLSVVRYESGARSPDVDTARKLAAALGVRLSVLLGD